MEKEDKLVIQGGQIVGCRGRVLVAVIILAVLILIAIGTLSYSLFSGKQQQPVRRAAADTPAILAHNPLPPAAA